MSHLLVVHALFTHTEYTWPLGQFQPCLDTSYGTICHSWCIHTGFSLSSFQNRRASHISLQMMLWHLLGVVSMHAFCRKPHDTGAWLLGFCFSQLLQHSEIYTVKQYISFPYDVVLAYVIFFLYMQLKRNLCIWRKINGMQLNLLYLKVMFYWY